MLLSSLAFFHSISNILAKLFFFLPLQWCKKVKTSEKAYFKQWTGCPATVHWSKNTTYLLACFFLPTFLLDLCLVISLSILMLMFQTLFFFVTFYLSSCFISIWSCLFEVHQMALNHLTVLPLAIIFSNSTYFQISYFLKSLEIYFWFQQQIQVLSLWIFTYTNLPWSHNFNMTVLLLYTCFNDLWSIYLAVILTVQF